MEVYSFKDEFGMALQNLSGKSIDGAEHETIGKMLHAFNALYTCIVTFSKTPADAVVVLRKGMTVIAPEEDGTYALKEGTYSYTASADGYFPKAATALTITNADETTGTKEVELTLTKYCVVSFATTPEDAAIVVKNSLGATVAAESDGTYNLAAATYSYSATKDGYVDITDAELVVAAGDVTTGTKEVTVTMTKYCVVTFTKTPTDLTLVVKDSQSATVSAEADGTYNLPAGTYSYSATKDTYTPVTDQALVISAEDVTTGTKAVEVTLVQ